MQAIKRIIFTVFLIIGIFFRVPAYAEDQNNFEAKFTFTVNVTNSNRSINLFQIGATGTFYIDYGDGSTDTITRTTTTQTTISHTYTSTGTKTVRLGGLATGYSTGDTASDSSIRFDVNGNGNTYITGISGSLGRIFPTLADGSQPLFRTTFADLTSLAGSIPAELFDGITGQPRAHMFRSLFWDDSKITGSIPGELFSGLSGTTVEDLFYGLFYKCSGLTGSIPGELFSGISGNQQATLFQNAFYNCSKLSGFIPPELFAGINTSPTVSTAFQNVFNGTTNMSTSCPTNYKQYTTGFESYFSSRVSCEPDVSCSTGYAAYGTSCYRTCSFSKKFMVSTGLSFDVFGEPESSGNPSMHIKLGDTECFVFSKPGSGSFNFKYTDEKTYHLVGAN